MINFFDVLFPPKCCVCDFVGSHLCDCCRYDLAASLLTGPADVLKDPYDGGKLLTLSACFPNPLLRQVIHTFKYTYNEELLDVLGKVLVARLAQFQFSPNFHIVPVPLHESRVRERGFNQSLLLGQYISVCTGFEVVDILERTRCTFPQAQLSRNDRCKNVQGAFSLKRGNVRVPEVIFLIDDVVTTGSTMSECQSVLYAAGAKVVVSLALTHGL